MEAVCNLWMWNVPEYSKDKYKRASKLFEFVYVSDKLMSWDTYAYLYAYKSLMI